MTTALRKADFVVELPGRGGGTTRRYVITNKGRAELERLKSQHRRETKKQLELLAYYCDVAGDKTLGESLRALAAKS